MCVKKIKSKTDICIDLSYGGHYKSEAQVSFYGPLTVMAFTYVRIYQAATAYR